jgi:m7GpppX diphosphatase
LLKSIRREASSVAQERWGIERGGLRMYIHYQPSYCE